jgi:hypothetical protein
MRVFGVEERGFGGKILRSSDFILLSEMVRSSGVVSSGRWRGVVEAVLLMIDLTCYGWLIRVHGDAFVFEEDYLRHFERP